MNSILELVQKYNFDQLARTESGNAVLYCSPEDYRELRTLSARLASTEKALALRLEDQELRERSLRARLARDTKSHTDLLDAAWADLDAAKARLAEAVECCTIKDNRNLWLEIRLQKIMARCADLLDEDQFNELDAMTRTTETVNGDSASAVQPERCCLDYPRCDCNSPPEPAQEPKGCNHFPGQVNCEWCTEVPHE